MTTETNSPSGRVRLTAEAKTRARRQYRREKHYTEKMLIAITPEMRHALETEADAAYLSLAATARAALSAGLPLLARRRAKSSTQPV